MQRRGFIGFSGRRGFGLRPLLFYEPYRYIGHIDLRYIGRLASKSERQGVGIEVLVRWMGRLLLHANAVQPQPKRIGKPLPTTASVTPDFQWGFEKGRATL